MTLHLSDIRPPKAGQVARARAIDAALSEAGYPNECVSATDQGVGVSRSWPYCDDWDYQVVVGRAFDITARLDPDRADRLFGGDGEVPDGNGS